MVTLKEGDKAPSFSSTDQDGKKISLADYKGKKLVIQFFPMAFTGVCTAQLCTMRDSFGFHLFSH